MNKIKNKTLCLLIGMCMVFTMIPLGIFADTDTGQENVKVATTKAETTKATATNYYVTASRNSKVKYRWGGYITSIKTGTTSSGSVHYHAAKTFTIKTYTGFTLNSVVVDGKNVGTPSTYTFKEGTTGTHTIKATYRRTSLFIMLDAGHANYQNKGVYSSYYESAQMWKLTNKLKNYLKKYPNIVVGMTKTSLANDPAVYTRGTMAKGYDLFISLHSNESSDQSTDYPLSIVSSGSTLYPVASVLGKKLAAKLRTTMNTKQSYQVWIKKQNDGRDWFGVVRGSAAVKVPGMILEHSFHSNRAECKWLLSSTHLSILAKAEASTIASYYGIYSSGTLASPKQPANFNAYGYSKTVAKVTWAQSVGATRYQIYRATSRYGIYKKVHTTADNSVVTYYDKGLKTNKLYYYKVRAYRYTGKTSFKYGSFTTPNAAKPR